MFEYIASIKSLIELANSVFKIKDDIRSTEDIFDEIVVPTYENMSKVTLDYLRIFVTFRNELTNASSMDDLKTPVARFRENRLVLLPLRRELRALSELASKNEKLAVFEEFFVSIRRMYREGSASVDVDHFIVHITDSEFNLELNRKLANLLRFHEQRVESLWNLLSEIYTGLRIELKTKRLK